MDVDDVLIVGGGPGRAGRGVRAARARVGQGAGRRIANATLGGMPRHCDHTGFGLLDLTAVLTGPPTRERGRSARDGRRGAPDRDDGDGLGRRRRIVTYQPARPAERRLARGRSSRPAAASALAPPGSSPARRPPASLTTGACSGSCTFAAMRVGRARRRRRRARQLLRGAHAAARRAPTVAAMVTDLAARISRSLAFRLGDRGSLRCPVLTECASRGSIGRGPRRSGRADRPRRRDAAVVECDTVVFTGDWIPDHELARRGRPRIDPGTAARASTRVCALRCRACSRRATCFTAPRPPTSRALDGRWAATSVTQWLSSGLSAADWPVPEIAVEPKPAAVDLTERASSPGNATCRRWRFLVSSAAFVRVARGRARQAGSGRSGRVAVNLSRPPFSMSDSWLDRVDPRGGTVTIAVDT